MPITPEELAFALGRPFPEQVAFFRGKLGELVPTATWRDLWKGAHDRAFMVAGAARADLLADLAAAVDAAIAGGETLDQFRARFGQIVQRHGWQGWTGSGSAAGRAWRTRIIYTTNQATSYAAGRLAQLRAFPLWVYRHGASRDPRPQHLAWDGLVLPADHPFWRTHYPPSAWNCSCYVVGARDMDAALRRGGKAGYTAPPKGWDTRDSRGRLPGVDAGWDYMPGASRAEDVAQAVAAKTIAWPYELAKAYMADVPAAQRDALAVAIRSQPETGNTVARYARAALAGQPVEPYRTLGLLTQTEAERIAAITGVDVQRELYDWAVAANELRHIERRHGPAGIDAGMGQIAFTPDDYRLLPQAILGGDIETAGTTGNGAPAIAVLHQVDGVRYLWVFELRKGRRMVSLKSARKWPAPAPNVRNASGYEPDGAMRWPRAAV